MACRAGSWWLTTGPRMIWPPAWGRSWPRRATRASSGREPVAFLDADDAWSVDAVRPCSAAACFRGSVGPSAQRRGTGSHARCRRAALRSPVSGTRIHLRQPARPATPQPEAHPRSAAGQAKVHHPAKLLGWISRHARQRLRSASPPSPCPGVLFEDGPDGVDAFAQDDF